MPEAARLTGESATMVTIAEMSKYMLSANSPFSGPAALRIFQKRKFIPPRCAKMHEMDVRIEDGAGISLRRRREQQYRRNKATESHKM